LETLRELLPAIPIDPPDDLAAKIDAALRG
jgi:hypothetical protein